MPPHFFGLAQRNGSGAPKKNALVLVVGGSCLLRVSACREWSSRCRMALLIADRALLRFARGTTLVQTNPRGQGGGAPNKRRDKRVRSVEARETTSVGGLRPPRPSRSPAPASAGGVSSPILPRKMGHIRKPCQVSGSKLTKHRNGRPHRAAKIPGGLCLPGIPYLAPRGRNRAAVRREGEPTRGTQSPSYPPWSPDRL